MVQYLDCREGFEEYITAEDELLYFHQNCMNPILFIESSTSQLLFLFYQFSGNLGVSIILLTLVMRFLLFPLSIKSLKSQKAIQGLKPEIDALKKKHGKDKVKLQQAQMELYKKYNINPLAGCLPYLVQIGFLILLYRVLVQFLGQTQIQGVDISPTFLWLDLRQPDALHIFPILAGITQFILSLMISPGAEQPDLVENKSKNKTVQKANEKEEDMAEMAMTMQKQMLFFMPIMTVFIAWKFQSGLALYWVATTIFSIFQQYYISGWGGISSYLLLAKNKIFSRA